MDVNGVWIILGFSVVIPGSKSFSDVRLKEHLSNPLQWLVNATKSRVSFSNIKQGIDWQIASNHFGLLVDGIWWLFSSYESLKSLSGTPSGTHMGLWATSVEVQFQTKMNIYGFRFCQSGFQVLNEISYACEWRLPSKTLWHRALCHKTIHPFSAREKLQPEFPLL